MRGWCQEEYTSPRGGFFLALGETSHRMANVTGVFIPDGIDGEAVRHDILTTLGLKSGPPSAYCMARFGKWVLWAMSFDEKTFFSAWTL